MRVPLLAVSHTHHNYTHCRMRLRLSYCILCMLSVMARPPGFDQLIRVSRPAAPPRPTRALDRSAGHMPGAATSQAYKAYSSGRRCQQECVRLCTRRHAAAAVPSPPRAVATSRRHHLHQPPLDLGRRRVLPAARGGLEQRGARGAQPHRLARKAACGLLPALVVAGRRGRGGGRGGAGVSTWVRTAAEPGRRQKASGQRDAQRGAAQAAQPPRPRKGRRPAPALSPPPRRPCRRCLAPGPAPRTQYGAN